MWRYFEDDQHVKCLFLEVCRWAGGGGRRKRRRWCIFLTEIFTIYHLGVCNIFSESFYLFSTFFFRWENKIFYSPIGYNFFVFLHFHFRAVEILEGFTIFRGYFIFEYD